MAKMLKKLREASIAFALAEREYLSKTGWSHTCDFPDFFWRWTKKIGKRTLALSQQDAISLQTELDTYTPQSRNKEKP